jgi:hypothetical protein
MLNQGTVSSFTVSIFLSASLLKLTNSIARSLRSFDTIYEQKWDRRGWNGRRYDIPRRQHSIPKADANCLKAIITGDGEYLIDNVGLSLSSSAFTLTFDSFRY